MRALAFLMTEETVELTKRAIEGGAIDDLLDRYVTNIYWRKMNEIVEAMEERLTSVVGSPVRLANKGASGEHVDGWTEPFVIFMGDTIHELQIERGYR